MFAEKAQIAKEQASDSEVKRFAAIKFSPHLLQKTKAPNRVLFVFYIEGNRTLRGLEEKVTHFLPCVCGDYGEFRRGAVLA